MENEITIPKGKKAEIKDGKVIFTDIVDLSIINNEDWFYVEIFHQKWFLKGNIIESSIEKSYHIEAENITCNHYFCKNAVFTLNGNKITKIRLCTSEEIETIKKHHPDLFEKEYPKSIDDVNGRNWLIYSNGNVDNFPSPEFKSGFSTEKRAKQMLVLGQLIEIMHECNRIDGWGTKLDRPFSIISGEIMFWFYKVSARHLFKKRFAKELEFIKDLM